VKQRQKATPPRAATETSNDALRLIAEQWARVCEREREQPAEYPNPVDLWRAILDALARQPEGAVDLPPAARAYLEQAAWRIWELARGRDYNTVAADRPVGRETPASLSAADAAARIPEALGIAVGERRNAFRTWREDRRAWRAESSLKALRAAGLSPAEARALVSADVGIGDKLDPLDAARTLRRLATRGRRLPRRGV
jgi:hypothetical protein